MWSTCDYYLLFLRYCLSYCSSGCGRQCCGWRFSARGLLLDLSGRRVVRGSARLGKIYLPRESVLCDLAFHPIIFNLRVLVFWFSLFHFCPMTSLLSCWRIHSLNSCIHRHFILEFIFYFNSWIIWFWC